MTKRLWLIDAAYLLRASKSLGHDYWFDYLKLRTKLETSGPIWKAYYLNSVANFPSDKTEGFHNWLCKDPPDGPGLTIKLYNLKTARADQAYCVECGKQINLTCADGQGHILQREQQKGVDVGIATLALKHRNDYDTLLLSSGDGDLLDAIDFLKETGKQIQLAVFRSGVSRELQLRAHQVHWLDDLKDDICKDRQERRPWRHGNFPRMQRSR
ncbi:MAG: NYN domain-containing protein [Rhodobacteraceae bacterium]|nr:NYN domain-containing protein [Paracoccaceae bacterium]